MVSPENWGYYALLDNMNGITVIQIAEGVPKLLGRGFVQGTPWRVAGIQRARDTGNVYLVPYRIDSNLELGVRTFPGFKRTIWTQPIGMFWISPDENSIAYMDTTSVSNLWFQRKNGSTPVLIANDWVSDSETVWLSSDKLAYLNQNGRVIEVSVATKERKELPIWNYSIGAISPSGDTILLRPFATREPIPYSDSIYKYDVKSGRVTFLAKWTGRLVGSRFVWSQSGAGFFFQRPVVLTLLRLSEAKDLFFFDLNSGKDMRIRLGIPRFRLQGGFQISENEATELLSAMRTFPRDLEAVSQEPKNP